MIDIFMYMPGLAVFLLIIFYLPLCLLILRFLKHSFKIKKNVLISIGVLMFLIPTWDGIVGKIYLDHLCESDGGNYVLTNNRVESVYANYKPSETNAKHNLKKGFDYVEMGKDGTFVRYKLDENNKLVTKEITEITSPYDFDSYSKVLFSGVMRISLSDFYLKNMTTGEIVGGYRDYGLSTYASRAVKMFDAMYATCSLLDKFKSRERFSDSQGFVKTLTHTK